MYVSTNVTEYRSFIIIIIIYKSTSRVKLEIFSSPFSSDKVLILRGRLFQKNGNVHDM